jgi:hypothetical protein
MITCPKWRRLKMQEKQQRTFDHRYIWSTLSLSYHFSMLCSFYDSSIFFLFIHSHISCLCHNRIFLLVFHHSQTFLSCFDQCVLTSSLSHPLDFKCGQSDHESNGWIMLYLVFHFLYLGPVIKWLIGVK